MTSKREFNRQNSFVISSQSEQSAKQDVDSEAHFWVSLIDTTAARRKLNDGDDDNPTLRKRRRSKSYTTIDTSVYLDSGDGEDLNNVVEQFDLTRASTDALFDSFDENNDGELSHREFRIALAQQDLFNDNTKESNANFERLIKYVDVNNDGALSRDEYAMCLQKLKLASLYLAEKVKQSKGKRCHMNTFSYTKDICNCEVAVADPLNFWFSSRNKKYKTSWIHMEGSDKQSIIQLASKYRFHPMFITDTIEMGHQQAKVRLDEGVFFVIFQQLQLTQDAHEKMVTYKKNLDQEISPHRPNSIIGYISDTELPPLKIETQQCPITIFLTGEPDFHTIVTIKGKWEVAINHETQDRQPTEKDKLNHQNIQGFSCEGGAVTLDVLAEAKALYGNRSLYTKVLQRLKDPHSTLRRGKGARIMYSILDAAIQTIKPILQCYQIQLAWFRGNLAKEKTGFRYIKQILFYKRHLGEMKVMLAPCKKVTATLMTQIPHMRNYFGDIDDELTTTLVSVEIYEQICEELKSEFEHYSDAFTNFILLVLTLVTGIFLPINLYTSFFGMNFLELENVTNSTTAFYFSLMVVIIFFLILSGFAARTIYIADFRSN